MRYSLLNTGEGARQYNIVAQGMFLTCVLSVFIGKRYSEEAALITAGGIGWLATVAFFTWKIKIIMEKVASIGDRVEKKIDSIENEKNLGFIIAQLKDEALTTDGRAEFSARIGDGCFMKIEVDKSEEALRRNPKIAPNNWG